MIALDLARALRTAGLPGSPQSGDRFVIDMPDLDDQSFVLSDLTVDVQHFGGRPVLAFNGTVEWALDSVTVEQAVWLPHEEQLRAGARAGLPRPSVRRRQLPRGDRGRRRRSIEFTDEDASAAYGRALLNLLTR